LVELALDPDAELPDLASVAAGNDQHAASAKLASTSGSSNPAMEIDAPAAKIPTAEVLSESVLLPGSSNQAMEIDAPAVEIPSASPIIQLLPI
jgi:hypothetical protein